MALSQCNVVVGCIGTKLTVANGREMEPEMSSELLREVAWRKADAQLMNETKSTQTGDAGCCSVEAPQTPNYK